MGTISSLENRQLAHMLVEYSSLQVLPFCLLSQVDLAIASHLKILFSNVNQLPVPAKWQSPEKPCQAIGLFLCSLIPLKRASSTSSTPQEQERLQRILKTLFKKSSCLLLFFQSILWLWATDHVLEVIH